MKQQETNYEIISPEFGRKAVEMFVMKGKYQLIFILMYIQFNGRYVCYCLCYRCQKETSEEQKKRETGEIEVNVSGQ